MVQTSMRIEPEQWRAQIRDMVAWLRGNSAASTNLMHSMKYQLFMDLSTRHWLRSVFGHPSLPRTGLVVTAPMLIQALQDGGDSMYTLDNLDEPLLFLFVMFDVETRAATNDIDEGVARHYIRPTARCDSNSLSVLVFSSLLHNNSFVSPSCRKTTTNGSRLAIYSTVTTNFIEKPIHLQMMQQNFAKHAVESHIHLRKIGNKLQDIMLFWNTSHGDPAFQTDLMFTVKRVLLAPV